MLLSWGGVCYVAVVWWDDMTLVASLVFELELFWLEKFNYLASPQNLEHLQWQINHAEMTVFGSGHNRMF